MNTWWKLASYLLIGMLSAACDDGNASVPTMTGGGDTPEAAVAALIAHLDNAEFDEAGHLSVPGQAALASLAEGATFSDVADALRDGDTHVSANFWAGFAQGAGGYLASASVTGADDPVVRDDVELHPVTVRPIEGPARRIFVRGSEDSRVDLFASFAAGLADRMPAAVERLITTNTDDARLILQQLKDVVPSLLVAVEQGDQPVEATQQILRLVELITRVG